MRYALQRALRPQKTFVANYYYRLFVRPLVVDAREVKPKLEN